MTEDLRKLDPDTLRWVARDIERDAVEQDRFKDSNGDATFAESSRVLRKRAMKLRETACLIDGKVDPPPPVTRYLFTKSDIDDTRNVLQRLESNRSELVAMAKRFPLEIEWGGRFRRVVLGEHEFEQFVSELKTSIAAYDSPS